MEGMGLFLILVLELYAMRKEGKISTLEARFQI